MPIKLNMKKKNVTWLRPLILVFFVNLYSCNEDALLVETNVKPEETIKNVEIKEAFVFEPLNTEFVPEISERPFINGKFQDVGFGYDVINNKALDIAVKDDYESFLGDSDVSNGGITGDYSADNIPNIRGKSYSFYPKDGRRMDVETDGRYEEKLKSIFHSTNPHAVYYLSRFSTGAPGRQQILGHPDLTEEAISLAEKDLDAFIKRYGLFYVKDNSYGVRGSFIAKLSFDASVYSQSDARATLRYYCNNDEESISSIGKEILANGHLEYFSVFDIPNYSHGKISNYKEFHEEVRKIYKLMGSDPDVFKNRFLDTKLASYATHFKDEEIKNKLLEYANCHMHWMQWNEIRIKLKNVSHLEMSDDLIIEYNKAIEFVNENLEKSKNFEAHEEPKSNLYDGLIHKINVSYYR